MKIIKPKSKDLMVFNLMDSGVVFLYNGDYYMKLKQSQYMDEPGSEANLVVNLETGNVLTVEDDEKCQVFYNSELHLK